MASRVPPLLKIVSKDNIAIDTQRIAATAILPSPFQQKIIDCPVDLVLPGGRGGGKSFGVAIRILRTIERYGADYQGVYIRKTYKGIQDFEKICRKVFSKVRRAGYNKTDKLWTFPNGATLELSQLEHEKDYDKFQGRSFTEIIIDEAGQYTSPEILDLMLSNLRGRVGLPLSRIIIANPGGVGHQWILTRYISNRSDGEVYFESESERRVITLNSTYLDNVNIDRDGYVQSLRSATANDAELRKAYIEGDWNIARGAYFATVLDRDRSTTPNWNAIPAGWKPFIGMDYGTAAPCAVYLAAISPGSTVNDRYYPRDSIVLLDELYLAQSDNPTKGLNLTIDVAADRIKSFCVRWGFNPRSIDNIADDACFATDGRDSIAALFLQSGVRFSPAKKGDRVSGWEHLRTMMLRADDFEQPGFYVSPRCPQFWAIVPTVPRSDRHPADVDTNANDHIADAVRYICLVTRRDKPQEIYASSFGGEPMY